MKPKTIIFISIVFVLYLMMGSVLFRFFEQDAELEGKRTGYNMREQLIANFSDKLSEQEIRYFIDQVMQIGATGFDIFGNDTESSNWDFHSAFFFSGTIVTTIGYGNNTPDTRSGKNFCMLYALIGIPLCGFLLTGIGEKLGKLAKKAEKIFYDRVTCGYPQLLRIIYIFILLGFGGVFFIAVPAFIFTRIEPWSFQEGAYYSFITVSTIGFGDYVIGSSPGSQFKELKVWFCFFWIIIGMSFLALIISLLSDLMTETAGRLREEQKQRMQQLKQLTRIGSERNKGDGEGNGMENEFEDGEEPERKVIPESNGKLETNLDGHINISANLRTDESMAPTNV